MASQARVYVGHLDQRTRESDLEKFFRGFGRIREISMKSGFAFVEFEDYRDADDVVHELNGKELMGSRVLIEFTRGMPRGRGGTFNGGGGYRSLPPRGRDGPSQRPSRGGGGSNGISARTPHRLVVENLSSSVSWQDLKDFMRQAGEVVFTDVFPKRNEGVVEFASASDLRNAMSKLDGKELNGRKIRLEEERYKSGGDRGRSRSRSRSRSPSRSRSARSRTPKSRSRSPKRKRTPSRSRSSSKSRGDRKSSSENANNIRKKRSASPAAASGDEKKHSKQRKSESDSGKGSP